MTNLQQTLLINNIDFKQLQSNGVTHIVASFGTVDLLNMHYNNQTPEVAQSLADCANNFVNTAAYDNMETVYIIPGYNKFTQTDFQQFEQKIQQQLDADKIPYIKLSHVMTTVVGDTITSYDEVIDVLTDGIHQHVQTGQKLLQTALSHSNITCDLRQSNLSPAYTAVQKRLPSGCYRC